MHNACLLICLREKEEKGEELEGTLPFISIRPNRDRFLYFESFFILESEYERV